MFGLPNLESLPPLEDVPEEEQEVQQVLDLELDEDNSVNV